MATRSSSACVALNNMRFMFTPRETGVTRVACDYCIKREE